MPYRNLEDKRRWQREANARTRLEWLDANGPCKQCGSPDDLQVDHIDASDKVSHRVWTWSKERREAELAKCQVLCKVCHDIKSKAEHAKGERHGNAKMTTELVQELRSLSGFSTYQLAARFGISQTNVRRILSGETWRASLAQR